MGPVSAPGGFFSYCQEFPLPRAFIFPRNTPQLKEKRKSKQKKPSLKKETFSDCVSLIRETLCNCDILFETCPVAPLPGQALGAPLRVRNRAGGLGAYTVSR